MHKFRLFLSFKKEEAWINSVQEEGYELVTINSLFPIYTFEKLEQNESFIPYVRLDCREKWMKKKNYQDYVTLFSDSGWHLIKGSRHGGIQYFQQVSPDVTRGIFSDEDSRESMKKRYAKYSFLSAFIFFIFFCLPPKELYHNVRLLWDFKSWYLTPNLWEMKGEWFLKAFIFETPFALFRGIPPYIILFFVIYYLLRALVKDD